MAAYLRFYQLEKAPFESEDHGRGFVLGTRSLRSAFAEIKQGLEDDLPRICVSGSAGVGKTSLCRALPKLLGESARVVPILHPERPWAEIRPLIAKKLELLGGVISRDTLLDAHDEVDRLVLVFDEAELLSHEILDHLDGLLRYKSEDGRQLLQCVMLANLERAAAGAETPLLWWLDEFTTLQLEFAPIPVNGMRHYVEKHLAKAGWSGDDLFDDAALSVIFQHTGGIPREINLLCEQALTAAGVRGLQGINADLIHQICGDPASVGEFDAPSPISGGGEAAAPSAQEMLDAAPRFDPMSAPREEEDEFKLESTFDFNTMGGQQPEPKTRTRTKTKAPARNAPSSGVSLELEDEPRHTEEPFFAVQGPIRSTPPPRFPARTHGPGASSSRSRSWLLVLLLVTITSAWMHETGRVNLFEFVERMLEKPAEVVANSTKPLKRLTPRAVEDAGVEDETFATEEEAHAADSDAIEEGGEALEEATELEADADEPQATGSLADFLADDSGGTYDPDAAEKAEKAEIEVLEIEDLVEEAHAALPSDPSMVAIEMADEGADGAGAINEYTALPEAASKPVPLPAAPAPRPRTAAMPAPSATPAAPAPTRPGATAPTRPKLAPPPAPKAP